MKRFIVTTSDDGTEEKVRGLLYLGNESPRADAVEYTLNIDQVTEIREQSNRADGSPRMTKQQRDTFWHMCGRYNVPFREDDYYRDAVTGMYEGWIGGREHNGHCGEARATIYVGVEKDGRSHT